MTTGYNDGCGSSPVRNDSPVRDDNDDDCGSEPAMMTGYDDDCGTEPAMTWKRPQGQPGAQ